MYNIPTNNFFVTEKEQERRKKIGMKLKGRTGFHHSVETKRIIGLASRTRVVSLETRKKLSRINKGNKNHLGMKHSEETKRKMSIAHKECIMSEAQKIQISLRHKGNKYRLRIKHTEDTKHRISMKLTGVKKKYSIETRQRISERMKGNKYGLGNHWRKGKFHSVEAKRKIGLAAKGRKHTEDAKRKISAALRIRKQYIRTEEMRYNMHLARTGKKLNLSEKTRLKMHIRMIGNKYRLGLPGWFKGKKLSEDTKQKIRIARLKQVIPVKNTLPERLLQKGLSDLGIIYETHKAILGQPDIFIEPNICVFADGDYWHNPNREGCKDPNWDVKVNEGLQSAGYRVIRFWEHEVKADVDFCVNEICKFVGEQNISYI